MLDRQPEAAHSRRSAIGKGENMSTGKAVTSTRPGKQAPATPQTAVQEALEVTWTLKGHLKTAITLKPSG